MVTAPSDRREYDYRERGDLTGAMFRLRDAAVKIGRATLAVRAGRVNEVEALLRSAMRDIVAAESALEDAARFGDS